MAARAAGPLPRAVRHHGGRPDAARRTGDSAAAARDLATAATNAHRFWSKFEHLPTRDETIVLVDQARQLAGDDPAAQAAVALAEAGSAGTMIFDEIDRGVGGAVASAIGERLARQSQVLVVTHSPQVAARAAHHFRIEKLHGPDGTRTTVRRLSTEERREEIARMLSGAAVTDEARAQAARLLEAA